MAPIKFHSLVLSAFVISLVLAILPRAIDSLPAPYDQTQLSAPSLPLDDLNNKKSIAMDIFLTSIRSRLEEEPSNNVIVVTGNESAGMNDLHQSNGHGWREKLPMASTHPPTKSAKTFLN